MPLKPKNSSASPPIFSHQALDFLAAGDLVTFFTAFPAFVCRRGGTAAGAVFLTACPAVP